jgi:hypothetical protein
MIQIKCNTCNQIGSIYCIDKKCKSCCDSKNCNKHKNISMVCVLCNSYDKNSNKCKYHMCIECCKNTYDHKKCYNHQNICIKCNNINQIKICQYKLCVNCCDNSNCKKHPFFCITCDLNDIDDLNEIHKCLYFYNNNEIPINIINKIMCFLDERHKCHVCHKYNDDTNNVYLKSCNNCDNYFCEDVCIGKEKNIYCKNQNCYHCNFSTCFNNITSYYCKDCCDMYSDDSNSNNE